MPELNTKTLATYHEELLGMQKLVEGIHYFASHEFAQQRELFDKLARSQHPQACFIACIRG